MNSWTNKDEAGGTHPSSPSVTFIERRRHSQGRHRIWTPLPHFPGLGYSMSPIQYPAQLTFPPISPNGPHSVRGPTSSILFASSIHHSPISTSSASNASGCHASAG